MATVKRKNRVKLGGKRWYDRLADELKTHEQELEQCGETYRALDQLLAEVSPDSDYFTELEAAQTFANQVYQASAKLSELPALLDKYSTAVSFHTKRATKIVKDKKREEQIVKDEEVITLGLVEGERIADLSEKVRSCYDQLWGLSSKMKQLKHLAEAMKTEPNPEKYLPEVKSIFYGRWIKGLSGRAKFRDLFGCIEELAQYQLFAGEEIAFYPFDKLRKME